MENSRKLPTGMIVLFAAIFAGCMAIAFAKETGMIAGEASMKYFGIFMGAILMAMGNLIPKFILRHDDVATTQNTAKFDRMAGWIVVITGVVQILIWLSATFIFAAKVTAILGLAMFSILILMGVMRGAFKMTYQEKCAETNASKRIAIYIILGSIFITYAIFAADLF